MLGLFFVVTFGSCLDVAAIQADMPYPIDFNNELGTVGLSNVIVGLSGSGYTGSYIFSQTIFSMRAGVAGRAHGWIIFALEAAIFLVPYQGKPLTGRTIAQTVAGGLLCTYDKSLTLIVCDECMMSRWVSLAASMHWYAPHNFEVFLCQAELGHLHLKAAPVLPPAVVQYLPNFFFGALLTVFGIEIAGDWLIRSYAKVRPPLLHSMQTVTVANAQHGITDNLSFWLNMYVYRLLAIRLLQ